MKGSIIKRKQAWDLISQSNDMSNAGTTMWVKSIRSFTIFNLLFCPFTVGKPNIVSDSHDIPRAWLV